MTRCLPQRSLRPSVSMWKKFTAQLALDYEAINVLQQHMIITQSVHTEEATNSASSKPEDVSVDASNIWLDKRC